MRKIIVATDFSFASKDALDFALQIAPLFAASVEVVNVSNGLLDVRKPVVIKAGRSHAQALEDNLDYFIEYQQKGSVAVAQQTTITKKVIAGDTEHELIKLSKSPEVALLVMGNTGSHGIEGKLFGTTTTEVAHRAHCPVLLIPKGISFRPLKNILIAANYELADDEVLNEINRLILQFEASAHFVHVYEEQEDEMDFQPIYQKIMDYYFVENKQPNYAININNFPARSLAEGIGDYCKKNAMDLVVTITQHRNFWKSLLHQNKSNSIIFTTPLPLLVLHKNHL